MNIIEINKVLSNQTRVDILDWLKDVEGNFPPNKELGHYDYGACVQYIKEKANLSTKPSKKKNQIFSFFYKWC